jgi:tRNA modification GTPase
VNIYAREETIAAISTPPGAGGIGIVRISGPHALPTLKALFSPKDPGCSYRSHQLYYGHIVDPTTSSIVDEVLAVYMAAPSTYTREELVEIHCHGSYLVLEDLLRLIFAQGVVPAEPGEFTKRAFLNGRIDLTQAEAVIDLLSARTRKGVELAQQQLSGDLFHQIEAVRDALIHARAVVEVAIDFPDEDLEIVDHSQLIDQLEKQVAAPLHRLLAGADRGRLYRDGMSMVIAGLPNVGKSSLLNSMLQEERALVTTIPGTTRDSIEEVIDIGGIPVRIIDTAGIRKNPQDVEELGIKRAKSLIDRADLVLLVIDGSRPLEAEDFELYREFSHKEVIGVINKIDLCPEALADISALERLKATVSVSAKYHSNIEELKETIFREVVSSTEQWHEQGCAPNLRHQLALTSALAAVERVLASLRLAMTYDLIAVDLQECLDHLGEIVGQTTTEDILDHIFNQFCLGK